MARPNYIITKDGEQKVVKSKELASHQSNGWDMLRQATPEECNDLPTSVVQKIETAPRPIISISVKPEIETSDPVIPEYTVSTVENKKVKNSKPKQTKSKKSKVPDDLVCPKCGIKARTEESYTKNHGAKCFR